ncbi:MAG: SAM-dependent methyltransferase [Pirellulaceae bacterium]|jgi:SAM-dependent methyltransferase
MGSLDESRSFRERELLADRELERSDIVANNLMNRERNAFGTNSYAEELGVDPAEIVDKLLEGRETATWLDMCCGTGNALIDAAEHYYQLDLSSRISFLGIDLVQMFYGIPAHLSNVRFATASLHQWTPPQTVDFITCIHGLHYVGDKLGLLQRAVSWLSPGGVLMVNIDTDSLRLADGEPFGRRAVRLFHQLGFDYNRRLHLLTYTGGDQIDFGYEYLGADDNAGPNYTGQPAVNSIYQKK